MENDKNLICFLSWGRTDLTSQAFKSLLESIREQDRLLVLDQEMLNFDFYATYKDKIDFLMLFKGNYGIGTMWTFLRYFTWWLDSIKSYKDGWYPDFINFVENDVIGKKGWIDRLLKIFELDSRIGIATGFDEKDRKGFIIDKSSCGVQMLIRTEDFIRLIKNLKPFGQDYDISFRNQQDGKLVGILAEEIKHIGVGRSKTSKSL